MYESLDASVAHFRATGLRPGAAHEFRVAALADADVANAADASADRSGIRFGASNFAVTPRRPPHSPAAPRAAKIAQTSILVAWDAAANDEEGRADSRGTESECRKAPFNRQSTSAVFEFGAPHTRLSWPSAVALIA